MTADVLAELGRIEPAPAEHRSDAKVLIRNPLAGVEIALWDIAAREEGVPLHELLGGAVRTQVEFSEYFAYRPGREESPSDVAAFCARMVEEHDSPVFEGKVAVHPVEEDVRPRARGASRDRPGSRAAPRREHGLASRRRRERALALLEPFDIANVEEPVGSFAELAELRRSTAIPFSSHTPGRRLGRGARGARHDRARARLLWRHRGNAALDRRLRGGRRRLLVLQRRPRHRDRRVPAGRRRHQHISTARASRCCAGRRTT